MTTLLLTRHGHVEGINPERFRGRAELPLTELGVHQAQAVARRIAATWQPAAIYTSPMSRCIATGQEIARVCGADTTVLEELNDLDYGDWQGQTHEEVRAHSPDSFDLWHRAPHLHRFPGGESLQDLVARIAEALRFALRRHSSDTVVLVGHNSGNRALLLTLLDQPLSAYWRLAQDPCCINEAEIVDGRITVLRVNETAHLPPTSPELASRTQAGFQNVMIAPPAITNEPPSTIGIVGNERKAT